MPAPDTMKNFLLRRKPERVTVCGHDASYAYSVRLIEVLEDGIVVEHLKLERIVPFTAIRYIQLEVE